MQWIHEAAEFVAVKLWCVDEMFSQQQTGRAGGSSTMDQKIKRSWDLEKGIPAPHSSTAKTTTTTTKST